jgi:hypothetical protein
MLEIAHHRGCYKAILNYRQSSVSYGLVCSDDNVVYYEKCGRRLQAKR